MISRKISFYFLLLLLCIVCFYYSCNTHDCSDYEITPEEEAFLSAYNQGDIAIFKNDTTGVYDTLHVTSKSYGTGYYFEPCNQSVNDVLNAWFSFSHLKECHFQIIHNEIPKIFYSNYIQFSLGGSLQSIIINGTSYNDVFVTLIDTTNLSSSYSNNGPWKINYSRSKGFIRFYMVNGQTWSKL